MYRLVTVCLISIGMLIPHGVFAQGVPSGATASITSSPRYPKPNQSITLTLEAYGLIFTDADIAWYINTTPKPVATGVRSITLITPSFGTTTHVSVIIGHAGGTPTILAYDIRPVIFDMIIESDTPVSPFLDIKMGVPEESRVAVSGILHRSGDTSQKYTYRWELGDGDNAVLHGQRAVFTMPQYETDLIARVYNTQGDEVYSMGTKITPATPHIVVYPYANGVIAAHPLTGNYVPTANTEAFYAEVLNSPRNPRIVWTINDAPIDFILTNPKLLTLSSLFQTSGTIGVSFPYGAYDNASTETSFGITH